MKKAMSILLSVSMLASLGIGQTAFGEEEDNVIRIGVCAPMTGALAVLGEGSAHSVEMAVEEINALGGYQIEIVNGGEPVDDASDSKQAINAYNSLMADDPDVIVGTYNSSAPSPWRSWPSRIRSS